MNLEEIKRIIEKYKDKLRRKFKVKEIGIFGSYVKGEQRRDSDIDILIKFEEIPTLLESVELENYLSEILGIKVDLVMKKVLKPRIRENILREVVYV